VSLASHDTVTLASRRAHWGGAGSDGGGALLDPRRIFSIHLLVIAGFALGNVPIAVMDGMGRHKLFGYSRLMRLEEEANLPSVFSALAIAACAVVAHAIGSRLSRQDPDRAAWSLLAWVFAFLALDEAAMIHELANRVGVGAARVGPVTYLGVFIYVPVLAWLAVRLFAFWLRQEPPLRLALLLGGVIYVTGAIGLELVENELRILGWDNEDLPMRISFIAEECGEMIGVAVLLRAFLGRFGRLGGGPLVSLAVPDTRDGSPVQNVAVSVRP
jgi:hypothetical protein